MLLRRFVADAKLLVYRANLGACLFHGRELRQRLDVAHVVLVGDLHAPVRADVVHALGYDLVPADQQSERRRVGLREVAPGCQLVPLGGAEGVILDVRRLDELGHWHLLAA